MKTYSVVPRGKKYWVEAVDEDGARQAVVGFPTEAAAMQCVKDLQRQERKRGAA